ncbi:MAG TPA: rRNA maturation RNase YbeY [Actinomycetota bacterium]|nr:rRNA maturation RNase YbeY [Actinomycetota bacterium]
MDDDHPDAGRAEGEPPDDGWPRILISDRRTAALDGEAFDAEALVGVARETLRRERLVRAELSLSFVDEAEIAELHQRYLGEPGPTDVLSFPLEDVDEDGARIVGDVVIAPAVAARNNPEDVAGELRLLVAHGVLHLLGYDHEEDGARTRMWERQERYSGVRAP